MGVILVSLCISQCGGKRVIELLSQERSSGAFTGSVVNGM